MDRKQNPGLFVPAEIFGRDSLRCIMAAIIFASPMVVTPQEAVRMTDTLLELVEANPL